MQQTDNDYANLELPDQEAIDTHYRRRRIVKIAIIIILYFIISLSIKRYYSYPAELKKSKESVKPLIQKLFGEYLEAQAAFVDNNYSSISGNCATVADKKYCDNFRNLHYAMDSEGREIHLIDKQFADAYIGIAKGAPIREAADAPSQPLAGVVFCESESWNPGDDYFKLAAFLIFHGEPVKLYEVDSRYPELLLPVN